MRRGVTAAVVNLDAAMTGDFTRAPDLAFPADRLQPGDRRRGRAGWTASSMPAGSRPRAGRRRHRRQPVPGRLRLAEGPDPAVARGDRARDRGQRRRRSTSTGAPSSGAAAPRTTWPPSRRSAGGRERRQPRTLDEIVDAPRRRSSTAYQDEAYARRYRERVARVREVEARRVPGRTELAEAVARNLFKLMAIKDEYEVARLWTDGSFLQQLGANSSAGTALEVHLGAAAAGRPRRRDRPPEEAPLRPLDAARHSVCWPASSACAAPPSTRSAARPSAGWSAQLLRRLRGAARRAHASSSTRAITALAVELARCRSRSAASATSRTPASSAPRQRRRRC